MATTYTYVVDKDWDSQQVTDIVTYDGAGKYFTFGTDGFASIYETIFDANGIKVPGAVGIEDYPAGSGNLATPIDITTERQTINIVNGTFSEAVYALADQKYTLDFSSIYTDLEHLTQFTGSITSTETNDVGIRVSKGTVIFGEEYAEWYRKNADGKYVDEDGNVLPDQDHPENGGVLDNNTTTISLNRKVSGEVGQWADSEFVVGGAFNPEDLTAANAIVNNTNLTVANWIWVGSQNEVNETANDEVKNTLIIIDSKVKSKTLQVRNTGALLVGDSTVDTTAMVLRHNATFFDSDITVGATGNFNVYGENDVTATLALSGSTLTAGQILKIGKADGDNDSHRAGVVSLTESSIGYAVLDDDGDIVDIVRSSDIAVNQNGTLTMDADSQIYATAITNDGTINITIDADGEDWINATSFTNTDETGTINIAGSFDGGVKRVIYAAAGSVDIDDIVVTATSTDGEQVTAATRSGKVALAAGVDYSTIYLSNSIDEDDDFAKEITDSKDESYYVDFNAFRFPASALDGVKDETTTILIDGRTASALTYYSNTQASIDGLSFQKDGTNKDPESETSVEQNVYFEVYGMDPADPASYRELTQGITVGEGVTFQADKMYQTGAGAVTEINGVLALYDTFQVAGGVVNVNSTGLLDGEGIISVIATNRYTQSDVDQGLVPEGKGKGDPIPAELNITGAPISLNKLEIGANSTVTLQDIEPNEDGSSKAVFANIVMRKTNVQDFDAPVLRIIDSQVTVTGTFDLGAKLPTDPDTIKLGRVDINFQSQLFVQTATGTIEGGNLNLTVTDEDVALLQNYEGQVDPSAPQPELFYTIVHARLTDQVNLTCDGDLDDDGYIDGTDYIYTSLNGQGLYVMHEDVAKYLYVNAAWEGLETGAIVGKGMFYNINAFSTFTGALDVAKGNDDYGTTITVLSDVTETYGTDLYYKEEIEVTGSTPTLQPVYFDSDIVVRAGIFDSTTGTASYPTEDPASWTVQFVNTNQNRMDLCISPAEGKTFTIEKGVDIVMGGTATALPDPIVSGPAGIWLDFWAEGKDIAVNSTITADMVGAKGDATIGKTGKIIARDFVVRAGENGENTVTVIGDPAATTAQITVHCLNFVDGTLDVKDSIVNSKLLLFTDDNVIGKQTVDEQSAVTSASFVLNSDNSKWNITGDSRGVWNYFYKDHPEVDGEPSFTGTLNFRNGSVLNADAISNVISGSTINADEGWTYAGNATPMTINFEGSSLVVGSTVNNAGEINLKDSTAVIAEDVMNTGTIYVGENSNFTVILSNTSYGIYNKAGGNFTIKGGTVTARQNWYGFYNEQGTVTLDNATFDTLRVGEQGIVNNGIINIDGNVFFKQVVVQDEVAEIVSVTGIIGNWTYAEYAPNHRFDGRVVFSVSNIANSNDASILNPATVDASINGGTVMFSKDGLTFDMAANGVETWYEPSDVEGEYIFGDNIVSAKLMGGTIYVDRKDIVLTDSGFDVPESTWQEGEETITYAAHTVYNTPLYGASEENLNHIKIAGGTSSLVLDKKVKAWNNVVQENANEISYNEKSLVIGDLRIAAGGHFTMDWSQCLTVTGELVAATLEGGYAITITLDPLEVYTALNDDKLVIAYDGFDDVEDYSFVENWNLYFTVHSSDEAGFDVTGLYVDASKFVKVSQDHGADLENGWYEQFNTVPGSQEPEDQGAVESEGSVILGLDGVFEKNVFLKDKVTMILGSTAAPLTFGGSTVTTIFAGGFDVSAMNAADYVTAGPAKLNMKIHEGDTNVLISGGTFLNTVVMGGDLVKIAGQETKVNYYRVGDINTVIDGGTFTVTTDGGQRMIVGGEFYQAAMKDGERVSIGAANFTGNVNLTISGGTFKGYDVYGGNYANVKTFGKYATIDGNVTITLDSSDQALVFAENNEGSEGGKIFAGSFGAGAITGDVKVILTGDEDITFEKLYGGCTGDFRQSTGLLESNVEGKRILSFTGFTGALSSTAVIDAFNTVEINGVNELNFDVSGSNFNLDVKNWKFAADANVSGTFAFDFTGDKVDMTALSAGFELANVTMTEADLANVSCAAGVGAVYDSENKILELVTLS